jgi:hypothetical protein
VARDYSNLPQIRQEITASSFGPFSLGYLPPWVNGSVFAQNYPYPPVVTWKMHICPVEADALRVAHVVLPVLLRWVVPHKVVYDMDRYMTLNRGKQRGKFITVYTGSTSTAQQLVDEIDPALRALGLRGVLVPTTRESKHKTHEVPIGRSGIIFVRYAEGEE